MVKSEPTPMGQFNHLYTGTEHSVMANRAGLHAWLMNNGGTIIVRGRLRNVKSENLGAGAYRVWTEEIKHD